MSTTSRNILTVVAVGLAAGAVVVTIALWNAKGSGVLDESGSTATAEEIQLTKFSEAKVFFGHQSVGGNVLDGIPGIYVGSDSTPPKIVESREAVAEDGGYLQHAYVGENGDPLGKIQDFDAMIRGGVGDDVDVALMKLCYVDVNEGTDVDTLFNEYKKVMAGLERDYPRVTFVHVTTPITTNRSIKGKIKALVGRGDHYGPEHNVAREKFNELMRAEYGDPGSLYDLAAVESTTPQGERIGGDIDGEPFYAMYDGYAQDLGHLNSAGSEVAAGAFVAVIADAVAEQ